MIESHFDDLMILEASDSYQAITLLENYPDVDLILSDYSMPDGDGDILYNYVHQKLSSKIPFILISSYAPEKISAFKHFFSANKCNQNILKPFTEESVVHVVSSVFKPMESNVCYKKILIPRLIANFSKGFHVDLFFKIGDAKFLKLIPAQQYLSVDDLLRYQSKGMEYLYFLEKDFKLFLENRFKDLLQESKHDDGTLSFATSVDIVIKVHSYVQELGLSELVIQTTNQIIQDIEQKVSQNALFADYLKHINKQNDYIGMHAHLTAYLVTAVSQKLKWRTDNLSYALASAALFQNLFLDKRLHAKILNLDQLKRLNFSKDEENLILEHPKKAAEEVAKSKIFPIDVYNLLLNHHQGFARLDKILASSFGPIDYVLIIAHHLADAIIESDFDIREIPNILMHLKKVFTDNVSSKIYQDYVEFLSK